MLSPTWFWKIKLFPFSLFSLILSKTCVIMLMIGTEMEVFFLFKFYVSHLSCYNDIADRLLSCF